MKISSLLGFSIVILLQVQKASSQVAELNIHSGHSAWIKDFTISTDEKYLATASYDYTVKLWDFKSGKEVRTLKGHKNYVSQVAFSKDGKILASGDIYGEVILWNVINGTIIKKLKRRQYREITSLAISDNNEQLISCSRDSTLDVIEIANDKEITWFKLTGQGLKTSFMPDNNQVVTLDDYGRIFLWDIKGDSSKNGVWYKQGRITDFTISRDGSYLITTVKSDTNNIRTFDIKSWKTLNWYKGHDIYPAAVCKSSDDSSFYTSAFIKKLGNPATYSIEIKKWDLRTGKCLDSLVTPRSIIYAFSLVLTPKSMQLLTMYSTNRLNVYQSSPLAVARAINGGGTLINAVFETDPGNFLLVADDGPIKKLSINRNEYKIFLPGLEKGAIRQAQISTDKKYLFALAYRDSAIYKISLVTNEKQTVASGVDHIREFFINREQTHILYRDMFSDSMSYFIDSSELIIKEINSNRILARKVLRSFLIIPYALLQDNASVIYQDLADTLTIWNSVTNKLTYLFDSSFVRTPIAKVLPYGKNSILTVTQTGMLQQWNWETGKLIQTVAAHPGSNIFDFEISNDEKYILTCGDDKLLKLWDAEGLILIKTFIGHESWVSNSGFMSNGKQVYSSAGDYTLRIWDIASGLETASLIMVDTADLITRLPNQYYTATRQATKFLSYKIGNELFPFEQFDLKYNRPHEVLRSLGTSDTFLIRAYEQAYNKRLKRAGLL